jgi:DNA-binding XRE family transcriptional regulator
VPAIIAFLGYNPLPQATNLGGQLARRRTTLGMTQKQAADRLGVDASTLAKWERGAGTVPVSEPQIPAVLHYLTHGQGRGGNGGTAILNQ